MGPSADLVARKRGQFVALCDEGLDALTLLERLRAPLRAVVPFDGAFVAATDPLTTLFGSAACIENLPAWTCAPYFDNEFLADDFNKFIDLHASSSGAVTLHRSTFGRPTRSSRHNQINSVVGFGAELRSTIALDGACWGSLNLLREVGRPDFTDEELAFVDGVGPTIARGLRRAVLTGGARAAEKSASTAVILLDGDGRVTSMTESAAALMAELAQLPVRNGGFPLPAEAYIVCARARAQAAGREGPEPTTRVQARSGGWLTLRGECTLDERGRVAATALVVEPSRNTEVLPLFVAAHDLSQREQEIVRLLARGCATREIAAELFISVHTVRDHVKSIFEKVGVGSRGELVSQLFHLHYQPDMATVTPLADEPPHA